MSISKSFVNFSRLAGRATARPALFGCASRSLIRAVHTNSSNSQRARVQSAFPTNLLLAVGSVALVGFELLRRDAEASSVDYAAVRKAIAAILDKPEYDDGSLGPVFVRLAWHASGTFDKTSKTGGSNGATMRFAPESTDGANNGLNIARNELEAIKKQFPGISYADLWTLAGVVAVEEMGGPTIPWRAGRSDAPDGKCCPPNGRLPDASKTQDHVRDVFYRMGFNDQEIVALLGAHALGRCHTDRSGYDGPWTNAPTTFSNEYFTVLLQKKWTPRKWSGPAQLEDESKQLMMTPADMAMVNDPQFRKYVELYAKDEAMFFNDFAKAFSKLLELGVPFK